MKQSIQNDISDSIRIVRSAKCRTLSKRSELSYHIGCKDESDIQLKIVSNSASGSFSKDWIDLQAVKASLDKAPRGAPITSNVLGALFKGKSVNNQLFLLAILVHEGLVRRSDGEKRVYERVDAGEFAKRTQALIEGNGATAIANSKNKKVTPSSATKARKAVVSTKSKKSPR